MAHRIAREGGTVVLDSEGLSKMANNDRALQVHLTIAAAKDARVVISAVTIAEVLRDSAKDANLNRVLKKLPVVHVDSGVAREAGVLLGQGTMTGTAGNPTVDALVAVTAIRSERPTVVFTSDPGDLTKLLDGSGVSVLRV
jgi:predicted nucleic acid-binding protein